MNLTATHINYFHVCRRKLWLFANGVNMEHTSETVAEGKLLHETSYPQRAERYSEIELSYPFKNDITLWGKIDFYDAKNKIIHEIKKSDKMEEAHEWQLKYYIWLLELNDIPYVTGILEYPKLHETKKILFTEKDRDYLLSAIAGITALCQSETCPGRINSRICKRCSYFDLCYVGETT